MKPRLVTLHRESPPLQTIEARREWKARVLLVLACLAGIYLVLRWG